MLCTRISTKGLQRVTYLAIAAGVTESTISFGANEFTASGREAF